MKQKFINYNSSRICQFLRKTLLEVALTTLAIFLANHNFQLCTVSISASFRHNVITGFPNLLSLFNQSPAFIAKKHLSSCVYNCDLGTWLRWSQESRWTSKPNTEVKDLLPFLPSFIAGRGPAYFGTSALTPHVTVQFASPGREENLVGVCDVSNVRGRYVELSKSEQHVGYL